MAAFTSSRRFSMREKASGVSSSSSCLMYPGAVNQELEQLSRIRRRPRSAEALDACGGERSHRSFRAPGGPCRGGVRRNLLAESSGRKIKAEVARIEIGVESPCSACVGTGASPVDSRRSSAALLSGKPPRLLHPLGKRPRQHRRPSSISVAEALQRRQRARRQQLPPIAFPTRPTSTIRSPAPGARSSRSSSCRCRAPEY
jgi:hypothetical protein